MTRTIINATPATSTVAPAATERKSAAYHYHMSTWDLTRAQMRELKGDYIVRLNEIAGEGTSWDELAFADELVSDAEIHAYYSGTSFGPDDFGCSARMTQREHAFAELERQRDFARGLYELEGWRGRGRNRAAVENAILCVFGERHGEGAPITRVPGDYSREIARAFAIAHGVRTPICGAA